MRKPCCSQRHWPRIGLATVCFWFVFAFTSLAVRAEIPLLKLEAGSQHSYLYGQRIARVAVGDPEIADVTVIDKSQLLITPKKPGATSLKIWADGNSKQPEEVSLLVTVSDGLAAHGLDTLGDSDLAIEAAGGELRLSGESASLEQHAGVRGMLGFDADNGVDATTLNYDAQVQIDIKIVEISKNRLQSAGFFLGKNNDSRTRALSSPGNISGVETGQNGNFSLLSSSGFLPNSDAFNFIYGRATDGLLGVISVLEGNGFAYTLAEPSLMAMSGQSANFLAGGEFPVPVRGASGTDNSVTIEYKEFGVRLSLTPTVLDPNRIALKVAPEVSELDFNAGIQSGGVAVPALRVRRTDTSVALGDGESFVISGLISQNTLASVDKVPGLGDIPIIGAFFQSKQIDRNDRELLMIVTPHLVRPLARDAALPALPGEKYRNYERNFFEFLFMEDGSFADRQPVSTGFSK
ncbi:type II and III secretion system protein family protein [Methylophaga sp. OBS4]|uniref:type II and III secretion system protein family protein n=1 Tax=Methylophaga sp. OBS4 TaxID=2991935 RepID=UPI002B1CD682|nr:type II and III secretion system protein family protein [Methylophaga sp. OBS4]